eukprot:TRINITY_DN620_c0_g2_i1.p1 TRINITY_DN620_c0_g2~~TRINITY_DN620_c0_g2_i1.p1  ORF type:complete len:428 (+),score=55.92 TRINITY_DN620_c0_g2_i1:122-1405(+)
MNTASASAPLQEEEERPFRYRKLAKIGDGATSTVFKGLRLDTKEFIAIKQVRAKSTEWEQEVAVFKKLSHPNIVRYLGTHRDGVALNILLEYAPGGSVAAQVKKVGCLPEEMVRRFTKDMLQGLEFVHSNGIMHRDIKAANLLLDDKGGVKLADFGASKIYRLGKPNETASADFMSLKGTLCWMAPEVVKMTGYGRKADIWSVGITVWEMLCGRPPFDFPNQPNAVWRLGSMDRAPEVPYNMSQDARDFITICLTMTPSERPNVKYLLKHPFITAVFSTDSVSRPLRKPTLESIPSSLSPSDSSPEYSPPIESDDPPARKGCFPRVILFMRRPKRGDPEQLPSPLVSPSNSNELGSSKNVKGMTSPRIVFYPSYADPSISPTTPPQRAITIDPVPSSFAKAIPPIPKGQFLRVLPMVPLDRRMGRKQ